MKHGDVFYTDQHGNKYWVTYRSKEVKTCRFRMDPVPGTGGKKWHFGDVYRRMKTTQEKRWSYAYPELTRGRRRKANLPCTWDDWARSDYYDRSWKSCTKRKRQWNR